MAGLLHQDSSASYFMISYSNVGKCRQKKDARIMTGCFPLLSGGWSSFHDFYYLIVFIQNKDNSPKTTPVIRSLIRINKNITLTLSYLG
jgi:hypothetical protein